MVDKTIGKWWLNVVDRSRQCIYKEFDFRTRHLIWEGIPHSNNSVARPKHCKEAVGCICHEARLVWDG